jgi:hypothetical protein
MQLCAAIPRVESIKAKSYFGTETSGEVKVGLYKLNPVDP